MSLAPKTEAEMREALARLTRSAEVICKAYFGSPPDWVEAIDHQAVVRARVNEQTVVMRWRSDPKRLTHEWTIMEALDKAGAPVPRPIGRVQNWILQSDAGRAPLSHAFLAADDHHRIKLLTGALEGLHAIHEAGHRGGLSGRLKVLGGDDAWARGVLAPMALLSNKAGVPPPDLAALLAPYLAPREARFIKWDARPANVLRNEAGQLTFIDWEHATARNRSDDFIWMICDEYLSITDDQEETLLATWLPRFGVMPGDKVAHQSVCALAIAHAFIRISVRMKSINMDQLRGRLKQQDSETVGRPWIGVGPPSFDTVWSRQLTRAARWAGRDQAFAPLLPWIAALAARTPKVRPQEPGSEPLSVNRA